MATAAATIARAYRTSIGKKVIMAVTGTVGIGYLILHIWGNLHIFEGREAFNHYGEFLRIVGAPVFSTYQLLWLIRIALLICVVLHVICATQLTIQSRKSRPVGYYARKDPGATWSSRTMRIGGVLILLYIIIHIFNLTTGWLHPSFIAGDVYHNVVELFQIWPVTLFYIVAMLAVGLHLYHGAWSMMQTLGFRTSGNDRVLRGGALALAVVFVFASTLVPLAVAVGYIG